MEETNEAIVTRIQAGDRALLLQLWNQVQAFVRQQAGRWLSAWHTSRHTLELEDLYQSGYIALCEAVETYQAGKGQQFLGWYKYYLQTAFAVEVGCRTKQQREDPMTHAVSLDVPVGEEDDGLTLGDTIPSSVDQYESADADIFAEQARGIINHALDGLKPPQADALRRYYLDSCPRSETAQALGITVNGVMEREKQGLHSLRHSSYTPALRELWYGDRNYYRGTGFQSWARSGSSAPEREAIRREELDEITARRKKRWLESLLSCDTSRSGPR